MLIKKVFYLFMDMTPKSLFFGLSILCSVQKKGNEKNGPGRNLVLIFNLWDCVSWKFIYNGCIAVIGDAGTGVLLWMVQWFSEYGESK